MTPEVWLLAASAAGIGFVHTLLGPDHYIPFVAMSRAGGWSLRKTALITSLCGLGRYSHALAGASILFSGVGIKFLGL